MGQMLTHLAQRMQGSTGLREASGCGINRTPEVPLVTGISVEVSALPIMGPPPMILPVSSGSPPAASISAEMGVPIRVRSEERRVGKEGRCRGAPYQFDKKKDSRSTSQ